MKGRFQGSRRRKYFHFGVDLSAYRFGKENDFIIEIPLIRLRRLRRRAGGKLNTIPAMLAAFIAAMIRR